MKEEIKIVARMKTGEMLKGYIKKQNVKRLEQNHPVYLRLAVPGNTIGTVINQDSLEGLFLVKSFEGNRTGFLRRVYYDFLRSAKEHAPMVVAATIMASLSLMGMILIF